MNNKKIIFALTGLVGGGIGGFLSDYLADEFLSWILCSIIDTTVICLFLLIGQSLYQTKSIKNITFSKLKQLITISVVFSVFFGFFMMFIFFIKLDLFNSFILFGKNIDNSDFIRFIGWGISGGITGFIISKFIPNLNKIIAVIFGSIGALIGCGVMYLNLFNLGYIFSIAIIGCCIGFVVVSAEEFLRKSWVEVLEYSDVLKTSGINMAKVVNKYTLTLGKSPIKLGYTSDSDIKLKSNDLSFDKEIAVLTVEGKKFFLNNFKTGLKTELLKDTPLKIQNCEIRVCY